MLRIVDRYLVREFVPPFLLGLFVLTFTLLTNLIVRLTEWFINKGVSMQDVARVLALSMPYLLVLTIPMAVLVGILMAFGRLSADSEIVAFKANGISVYRLCLPIFGVALLAYGLSSWLYIRVLPETNLALKALKFQILKTRASVGLKPHVFNTFFNDQVIYIDDLDPDTDLMSGVFLSSNDTQNSRVFFARTARKIVDEAAGRVTLLLTDGIWHRSEQSVEGDYGVAPFDEVSLNLDIGNPALAEEVEKGNREMTLKELRASEKELRADLKRGHEDVARVRDETTETDFVRENKLQQMQQHLSFTQSRIWRIQVEYQKKFAIPFACVIFAVIGVPLGIRGTRSGRSAGFAISIGLFILYYMLLIGGEGLGNEGKLPASLAIWGANLLFGLVGMALILVVGRESQLRPLQRLASAWRSLRRPKGAAGDRSAREAAPTEPPDIRFLAFPRILDLYIARDWLVIFFAVVLSITAISNVVHLFEKLDDINRNSATLDQVFRYMAARTPGFGVITIHIAALVATVLTISGLNRRSELTAIRSSGIRLLRVALPVMLLGLLVSAGVWVLNEQIVPQTNRKANDIFDYEIRGRAPTKLAFNRNWYRSSQQSILYYTVRESRPDGSVALNRFTLFRLGERGLPVLRVEAERAVWEAAEKAWHYEKATIRTFDEDGGFLEQVQLQRAPADLTEKPEDFEREISDSDEMNYWQLRDFIEIVRSQGNDPAPYVTDLYGKVSFCLISFVMVIVGFPLAAVSNRSGKLAWGIVISIVIGVTFFVAYRIGISIGHSDKLSPLAAAFLPLGVYLAVGFVALLKME